jgi:hypothetical protein
MMSVVFMVFSQISAFRNYYHQKAPQRGGSMIREGGELFQQRALIICESSAGRDEVGSCRDRAVQRLGVAPTRDASVVTAAEYGGNLPAAKVGWSGEIGLLQKS